MIPIKVISNLKQFILFGFVSFFGLLVDYSLLLFLVEILNLNYAIANLISVTVSILFNYHLSNKYVFKSKKKMPYQVHFIFFIFINIIAIFANTGIFILIVEFFEINYMIAKIIPVIFSFLINFFLRKIFLYN